MAKDDNKKAVPQAPVTAQAPQPDADIQERIDGFNKELQPLLGKYELGLGALPVIQPNGTIGANPVILSMRGRAEAAPAEAKVEPKAGLSE